MIAIPIEDLGDLTLEEGEDEGYCDEGCDFVQLHPRFPACLSCPLPVCRYELQAGQGRVLAMAFAIAKLARRGHTAAEIAATLGVGVRTVQRVARAIARARLRVGLPAPLPPASGAVVRLAVSHLGAPARGDDALSTYLVDRDFLLEMERDEAE